MSMPHAVGAKRPRDETEGAAGPTVDCIGVPASQEADRPITPNAYKRRLLRQWQQQQQSRKQVWQRAQSLQMSPLMSVYTCLDSTGLNNAGPERPRTPSSPGGTNNTLLTSSVAAQLAAPTPKPDTLASVVTQPVEAPAAAPPVMRQVQHAGAPSPAGVPARRFMLPNQLYLHRYLQELNSGTSNQPPAVAALTAQASTAAQLVLAAATAVSQEGVGCSSEQHAVTSTGVHVDASHSRTVEEAGTRSSRCSSSGLAW